MKKWNFSIWLVLVCIAMPALSSAQDRRSLESKRNKLIEQIEYTNKLLKQSQKTKTATLEDYKLLQKQMKAREELLVNLKEQLEELDLEMNNYTDSIAYLETEIQIRQKAIRQIAQEFYMWKKSHNEWAYLLSAGSWKSALLRWNVLNRVKTEAQRSAEAYRAAKYELQQLIEQHKNLREDQSVLMADTEKNVKALASEAHAKKQSLSQLEKQERNLRIDLERKNKERTALNKAIEAAIVAELKAAESEKESLADAPAMAKLAKGFQQNKGKLPWPLSKGVITSHFGKHAHPTLKQVTIVNNGIDIRTEPGATAKAIFDGKVVGVKYIPGFEQMVIVQHGSYYSVYSKLDEVAVSKGQSITTGQTLGTVWQNPNSGIFELHLEIWNGKSQMDPEAWIARR